MTPAVGADRPASTSLRRRSFVLRVNPILCDGRGICAELLPEMISMDEWGFPIVDGSPVPSELLALAKRATAACPTLALRLSRASS